MENKRLVILPQGQCCLAFPPPEVARAVEALGYELLLPQTPEQCDLALSRAQVALGEPSLAQLSKAPGLRWLQMTWAGADRYLQGGFPRGLRLTTASGAFGQTIAEHALALLLALCRRLPAYGRAGGRWQDLGPELSLAGKQALIFGTGDLGRAIARRLRAFGMELVGVRRRSAEALPEFDAVTDLDRAEALLGRAQVILGALPHNPQTAGYLDARRLAMTRPDAVLVNVGRGSFVDLQALTGLLQQGRFFGVGLDVFETEPLPPAHPLWAMDRVILTPHVAGVGFGHLPETEQAIWEIFLENLRRYSQGQPLRNEVRP